MKEIGKPTKIASNITVIMKTPIICGEKPPAPFRLMANSDHSGIVCGKKTFKKMIASTSA